LKLDGVIHQMIRAPPPDLVQQHSPLPPTAVIGNSPVHRPSPSSSPPYKTQGGPGRPVHFRVRRNSTSSVSSKAPTPVNGIDREGNAAYQLNQQTPVGSMGSNLNTMTSPRPDVTHSAGSLPPSGSFTSRGRNPIRRDNPHRKETIKDILQPYLSDSEHTSRSGNIRHSPSEPALHQRSHSTSRSSSLTRNRPDLTTAMHAPKMKSPSVSFFGTSSHSNNQEFVPALPDKSSNLDLDDFLPRKFGTLSMRQSPTTRATEENYTLEQTELEVVANVAQGHKPMSTVLNSRHRNLQVVHNLWQHKDAKLAVETAVGMNDPAVIVDLLSVIIFRPFLWSLDLCVLLLPAISDLLQSKFEVYVTTSCNSLRLILKNFAPVIKTNIEIPSQGVGVDITRQERFNKCMSCYSQLVPIKAFVLKRQAMAGKMGQTFRELHILLQVFD